MKYVSINARPERTILINPPGILNWINIAPVIKVIHNKMKIILVFIDIL
jgi:hypothetical protein